MPPHIAFGVPLHIAATALIDHHALHNSLATHRKRRVHRGFKMNRLATAQAFVGGHHHFGTCIENAVMQTFCREAAEHHRMNCAEASACLHRHHRLYAHRHIDHHAITFDHIQRFKPVGKLAYALMQFTIIYTGDFAIIGFKNQRGFVRLRSKMAV